MKTLNLVIEGMPGAGKTSLLNMISKNNPAFVCHQEIYLPNIESISNDLERESKYLDAEIEKLKHLKNGEVNIFDRNFISTLAYSFAIEKIDPTKNGLFNEIKNLCYQKISDGSMLLPDVCYILLINPELSMERRSQYANDNNYSIWFNKDFLNAFYQFYKNTEFGFILNDKVKVVYSETTELEQNYKDILNTIYEYRI